MPAVDPWTGKNLWQPGISNAAPAVKQGMLTASPKVPQQPRGLGPQPLKQVPQQPTDWAAQMKTAPQFVSPQVYGAIGAVDAAQKAIAQAQAMKQSQTPAGGGPPPPPPPPPPKPGLGPPPPKQPALESGLYGYGYGSNEEPANYGVKVPEPGWGVEEGDYERAMQEQGGGFQYKSPTQPPGALYGPGSEAAEKGLGYLEDVYKATAALDPSLKAAERAGLLTIQQSQDEAMRRQAAMGAAQGQLGSGGYAMAQLGASSAAGSQRVLLGMQLEEQRNAFKFKQLENMLAAARSMGDLGAEMALRQEMNDLQRKMADNQIKKSDLESAVEAMLNPAALASQGYGEEAKRLAGTYGQYGYESVAPKAPGWFQQVTGIKL